MANIRVTTPQFGQLFWRSKTTFCAYDKKTTSEIYEPPMTLSDILNFWLSDWWFISFSLLPFLGLLLSKKKDKKNRAGVNLSPPFQAMPESKRLFCLWWLPLHLFTLCYIILFSIFTSQRSLCIYYVPSLPPVESGTLRVARWNNQDGIVWNTMSFVLRALFVCSIFLWFCSAELIRTRKYFRGALITPTVHI